MKCEGARCSRKKKPLGKAVWIVDGVAMCATCFENWMDKSCVVFDQHKIIRRSGTDSDFEIHKGKDHASTRRGGGNLMLA